MPEDLSLIEAGIGRHMEIDMDPGGDIYVKLSREAGKGVKAPGERSYRIPTFSIKDISSTAKEFEARGLETILLPSLWVVEDARRRSESAIQPWD